MPQSGPRRRTAQHDAPRREHVSGTRQAWIKPLLALDWDARPGGKAGIIALLTFTLWLNWSSTFYLVTVLAKPIVRDTGWSLTSVITGLSLSLVVAGIVSPLVGRTVQRRGGRPVLALGSLILAIGLAELGFAPNRAAYFLAWAVIGAGMAASLYEAAFAALGRLYGLDARAVISNLMLTIAFAVALSWPFAQWGTLPTLLALIALSAANLALSYSLRLALPRRQAATPTAEVAADAD